MADYTYPSGTNAPTTFGQRDGLAPGSPDKVVKGSQLDQEFNALVTASASKMDKQDPTFSGTMNGGAINGGTF